MLKTERRNDVLLIELDRAGNNALDPDLIAALRQRIRDAGRDDELRALVIGAARGKFFSIGLDIPTIIDFDARQMREFMRAFDELCLELYALPKPSVAALTGHAVAGGCILALCCDERIIAEGRRLMGLNEIRLGLPVPYPAACILRDLVGGRSAREIIEGGEFTAPEESLRLGLVDRVIPEEEVLPTAWALAERQAALPRAAFARCKKDRTELVVARARDAMEKKIEAFVWTWFLPETRKFLELAREKF